MNRFCAMACVCVMVLALVPPSSGNHIGGHQCADGDLRASEPVSTDGLTRLPNIITHTSLTPLNLKGWTYGDLYVVSLAPVVIDGGVVTAPPIGGSISIVAPTVTITSCGFVRTADATAGPGVYMPSVPEPVDSVEAWTTLGPNAGSIVIAAREVSAAAGSLIDAGNGAGGESVVMIQDGPTLDGFDPQDTLVYVGQNCDPGEGSIDVPCNPACPNGDNGSVSVGTNGVIITLRPDGSASCNPAGLGGDGVVAPGDPIRATGGGNGGSVALTAANGLASRGLVQAGNGGDAGNLAAFNVPFLSKLYGAAGGRGGSVSMAGQSIVHEGSTNAGSGGAGGGVTTAGILNDGLVAGNAGAGGLVAVDGAILLMDGSITTGSGGHGGEGTAAGVGEGSVVGGIGGTGGDIVLGYGVPLSDISATFDVANGGDGGDAFRAFATGGLGGGGAAGGTGGPSGFIIDSGGNLLLVDATVLNGIGGAGGDASTGPTCDTTCTDLQEVLAAWVGDCFDPEEMDHWLDTEHGAGCVIYGTQGEDGTSKAQEQAAEGCSPEDRNVPPKAKNGDSAPSQSAVDGKDGTPLSCRDGADGEGTAQAQGGNAGPSLMQGKPGGSASARGGAGGDGGMGQHGGDGNAWGNCTDWQDFFNSCAPAFYGNGGDGAPGGDGGRGQAAAASGGSGGYSVLACGGRGGNAYAKGGTGGYPAPGGNGGHSAGFTWTDLIGEVHHVTADPGDAGSDGSPGGGGDASATGGGPGGYLRSDIDCSSYSLAGGATAEQGNVGPPLSAPAIDGNGNSGFPCPDCW